MTKWLKNISESIVYLCGILLFASVFLISTEVVLRKFFLISFGGTDEISGYILGICTSWSLAYVLFDKMHIRIDILYTRVSKRFQYFLDVIAMVFTLLFISLLTYSASSVFYTSIIKNSTANTPLGTPLWIPQSIWFFGFIFFLIVVVVLLYLAIKSLVTNKDNGYSTASKDEICI
jgi:TRAP-type mannitol/chloroaromatic compound transport system permease small subunit